MQFAPLGDGVAPNLSPLPYLQDTLLQLQPHYDFTTPGCPHVLPRPLFLTPPDNSTPLFLPTLFITLSAAASPAFLVPPPQSCLMQGSPQHVPLPASVEL